MLLSCPSLPKIPLRDTSPLPSAVSSAPCLGESTLARLLRHRQKPARPVRGRITNPCRQNWRRPSRAREGDIDVILAAVPAGSRRLEHLGDAVPALRALPAWQDLSRTRRRLMESLVGALAACADWSKMISRPGHKRLAKMIGRSASTVTAAIAWLMRHGVIGRVAAGRSAAYATPDERGKRINEAAVYVLCCTAHLDVEKILARHRADAAAEARERAGQRRIRGAVEKNWHPSSLEDSLTRTRRGTTHARDRGLVELWPCNRAVATRRQQLAAARTVQDRALGLRVLSARDVRSLIRPFLEAGWTPADLLHALDHTPQGAHRLHSLDAGQNTARARGYLRWRLEHWKDAGGLVLASASARARERAEAAREAMHRDRQADARARAAAAGVESPARIAALAAMRMLFRQGGAERDSLEAAHLTA